VTAPQVRDAARKWFDIKNAMIFVVGNPKLFASPLSEFGEVHELKAD